MKTNREEILQNALQLFMSKNYEGVSLQMIAHSVGLTKTGIFNYYPTKLDLFIAVADRYLFHLQDPENKFAPSDGSLRDFIDKYVEGVERTMGEIVRLGNIQREKMPGQLANAGYFHLYQQVLFYYPDGKHKLHEWMEKEEQLWNDIIRGGGRARRTARGYRHSGDRCPVPAGFHRTGLPDVLLRRSRCRNSPQAFPLYIRVVEALRGPSEGIFQDLKQKYDQLVIFLLFYAIFASMKNDQQVTFMENKPFERIQRSFNYTPESIFTNQWSNLAFGVGMIIIPALFPFGLRIRHLRILSPAVFSTILILGGVLLLFFTWRSMRNARALKAAGGKITVDGTRVTYPEVEKGKVEYRSFLTTDIEYVKDDEEEHQCKVKTPDNYIIFEAKYFDSWEEFEAFRALLG
uniref:TetR/AcrR family transcriptional regulator n=1 Tax=Alistipes shahii TaxID=328814 RepID=UPI003FEEC05D